MPRDPNRRFDQTQLLAKTHGLQIHRDYAAHFFRWSYVKNRIWRGIRILDVGCGHEHPMLEAIRLGQPSHALMPPELYVGVDLNKIKPVKSSWIRLHEEFSFVDDWRQLLKEYGATFDWVTCFEVIEHMKPVDGLKLLKGMREFLKDDGYLHLSTPIFSGQAAKNHVHEYGDEELQRYLSDAGFTVMKRFGTFMQLNKLKRVMSLEEKYVYDRLSQYYDHAALSVIFAPLHPQQASNNLWLCQRNNGRRRSVVVNPQRRDQLEMF